MARQRMLAPGIWTDDKFGTLDPFAMLVFIGCISNADDEGKFRADPRCVRGMLFPYLTGVTPKRVEAALQQIEERNMIHRWEVGSQRFAHLPKWLEHQKIKYPSKSKMPDCPQCQSSGNASETLPEDFSTGQVKSDQVSIGEISQVKVSQEEDREKKVSLGQGAGAETRAEETTHAALRPNDPKIFSSSSTDLDPTDLTNGRYYDRLTDGEIIALMQRAFRGRTKPLCHKQGTVAVVGMTRAFTAGEIVQGIERVKQQHFHAPDEITDVGAYLLTTLDTMRAEDKFQKPARAGQ